MAELRAKITPAVFQTYGDITQAAHRLGTIRIMFYTSDPLLQWDLEGEAPIDREPQAVVHMSPEAAAGLVNVLCEQFSVYNKRFSPKALSPSVKNSLNEAMKHLSEITNTPEN